VLRAEIEGNGYDLSLNRYKAVVHEVVAHRAPAEILAELEKLEAEIQRGMRELAGMVA
jgi:type I restriction enzyme M protein